MISFLPCMTFGDMSLAYDPRYNPLGAVAMCAVVAALTGSLVFLVVWLVQRRKK
jgi:hypothetical protein